MNSGSNFQMSLNQSDLIIWLREPSLNTLAREFLQFHTRLKHFSWHIEIELQRLWEYKSQRHIVTCRESSRLLSQGFLLSHNPIKNSNVSNYFPLKIRKICPALWRNVVFTYSHNFYGCMVYVFIVFMWPDQSANSIL